MTDAERTLWGLLRSRRLQGHRFRRQFPIGPYVADFVCLEARLIVEADGGQHAENGADSGRTEWLRRQGFRILRFWNHDVLANPHGVLAAMLQVLASDNAGTRLKTGEIETAWELAR